MNASELRRFWDAAIAEGLAGQEPRQSRTRLQKWFNSSRSTGRGQVTTEGFPEPYIGSLPGGTTPPKVVMLGLNPGAQDVAFRSPAERPGSVKDRSPIFGWA